MKILIVDDEPLVGLEISEYLSLHGYRCLHCCDAEEALMHLQTDRDITLVVTDLRMPGSNGIELIEAARDLAQFGDRCLEFIVVTGYTGTEEAISALRSGACEFLEKPLRQAELLEAVKRAERTIVKRKKEQEQTDNLTQRVVADGKRIDSLLGSLDSAYAELTYCLATASEHKDPETGRHIVRIGEYAALMGDLLGWSERKVEMIRLAAPLHDVGKIGTPDSVLLKPGKLTELEMRVMGLHTVVGHKILSRSNSAVLKMAASIALHHHEKWDGSGYPEGLSGQNIPLEAMITALADVYDALRSPRPYKDGMDHATVRDILLWGDGRTEPSHFPPHLLHLFEVHHEMFNEVYQSMRDEGRNEVKNQVSSI
ncbi:MAG: HD domain-containing phosphohydrolase [Halioglobus sp.]